MAATRMHWNEDSLSPEPLWTTVPDITVIEAISRCHLLPSTDTSTWGLTVTFLGEGSFNKAYTIDVTTTSLVESYVFRAALPIEPGDKVRNEVATLDYIKRHTSIPVPAVIAYDSSSENALGFEWILMEKIPGITLRDIWTSLSDTSKVAVTCEIAGYALQIRENCTFYEIGGLYHDVEGGFILGPIVNQFVFLGARRQLLSRRNRGPYHHDSDLVRALIDIQIADVQLVNTIPSDDPNFDKDVFDDGPSILHAMQELGSLVPLMFPKDAKSEPYRTVLMHPDLSLNNIMIDSDTLKITGIIDWECTNASPQWQHPYPRFLTGPEVEEEADRVEPGDTDRLRNNLWDNWEKMQLRAVFDEVAGPLVEGPLALLKREFLGRLAFAEQSQILCGALGK
jgi:hypothetical protein